MQLVKSEQVDIIEFVKAIISKAKLKKLPKADMMHSGDLGVYIRVMAGKIYRGWRLAQVTDNLRIAIEESMNELAESEEFAGVIKTRKGIVGIEVNIIDKMQAMSGTTKLIPRKHGLYLFQGGEDSKQAIIMPQEIPSTMFGENSQKGMIVDRDAVIGMLCKKADIAKDSKFQLFRFETLMFTSDSVNQA